MLSTQELSNPRTGQAGDSRHLETVLAAARVGYWENDLRTGELIVSAEFKANWGLPPEALFTVETLRANIHPDDWQPRIERIKQAIRTGTPVDMEYRTVWPDGSIHWVRVRGTPQFDAQGKLTRLVGISLDVTDQKRGEERLAEIALENARLFKSAQDELAERRRIEEHQELLLAELNHRVKNTLAIVLSISTQTLRHSSTAEGFRTGFEARIMALAEAHNLLTDGNWEGASLRAILERVLSPYRGDNDARFVLSGEGDVRVGPKTAVSMTMAFSELATNAAKYGALSGDAGVVNVSWTVKDGTLPLLHIRWEESGGPRVKPPRRKGFGTRLIRSLSSDAAAEVMMDFAPEGFVCTFDLPLRSGAEA